MITSRLFFFFCLKPVLVLRCSGQLAFVLFHAGCCSTSLFSMWSLRLFLWQWTYRFKSLSKSWRLTVDGYSLQKGFLDLFPQEQRNLSSNLESAWRGALKLSSSSFIYHALGKWVLFSCEVRMMVSWSRTPNPDRTRFIVKLRSVGQTGCIKEKGRLNHWMYVTTLYAGPFVGEGTSRFSTNNRSLSTPVWHSH